MHVRKYTSAQTTSAACAAALNTHDISSFYEVLAPFYRQNTDAAETVLHLCQQLWSHRCASVCVVAVAVSLLQLCPRCSLRQGRTMSIMAPSLQAHCCRVRSAAAWLAAVRWWRNRDTRLKAPRRPSSWCKASVRARHYTRDSMSSSQVLPSCQPSVITGSCRFSVRTTWQPVIFTTVACRCVLSLSELIPRHVYPLPLHPNSPQPALTSAFASIAANHRAVRRSCSG